MKTKQVLQIVLNCLVISIFIGAGITVLVLRQLHPNYDAVILGSILLVAGGSRGVIYYINRGYKYTRDITIISALVMVAMGLIFLLSGRDLEMLCFGWGIMEIILGSIEVYIDFLEIKETKIAWLELIVNASTIIFGVLLCIKLYEGLTIHIIFLSISLFLLAIIALIKFIKIMRTK